ncbi:sodium:solute symporter [Ekhidna sp.]|jgi:sodium/pantothenate symporter|uniref:sodium/pantothenate symporter n=1 Tax=Ekhidna sp. TaxID=2608089 RepID=UPI0032ED90AA
MASESFTEYVWVAVIAYMALILFFVIRGAIQTKNISDYALGNIAFSPIAVGLALAASMTSAATFIINPGFIAYYGISGFLSFGLVLSISSLVSLIVITKGFRKVGTSVKALTMAQWIGSRYENKSYALFFGFVSLLLITFIVLICVGLSKLLSKALNVEEIYILISVVVFVFGYMMFGGANSMVYTNMIQASLMIVVAIILLTSGYEHFSDGISGFLAKLKAIDPALADGTNPQSPLFRDYFEIIFCQVVVGIAIVCQPHIITKSLLLKNDNQVNTYLIAGVIVEFLFFLVVFAGLYARLEFPNLTVDGSLLSLDGVLSAYVVKKFTAGIGIIVVMGLISAGLSTLEGLIQSLSTTITQDVIRPIFGEPKIQPVILNRLTIIFLAVVSFGFSWQQLVSPDLSVGIFAQNGVYAYFSAAFVPVLFGTFLKQVPVHVPFASSISAIIIHFSVYYGRLTPYMQEEVRNPAIASTLAILGSLAIGLILHAYAKSRREKISIA